MSFNPIEQQIYDYVKQFPQVYVSATEVSRSVGNRKWFNADRNWARPILRRLEMDGWLESNPFGEYRVKRRLNDTTTFRQALSVPGMALGETTIISLDGPEDGTGSGRTTSTDGTGTRAA